MSSTATFLRTIVLALPLVLPFACEQPNSAPESPFSGGRWIDLTYAFNAQTVVWPTSDPFKLDTVFEGITDKGYYYSAYKFQSAEHGGTHLDAPIHFAAGKQAVEEIPLDRLIRPAVVIDVSDRALKNRDYQISVADFEQWEREHGTIPGEAIILLRTGYGRYWPDPVKYMGTAEKGEAGVAQLHFPGLHPDAARWLTENRNISAIGLDTPSLDYGQSTHFESHQILFEHNIPGFENIANLDQLPPTGSWVIALPMKIAGGSGGPLRIVAWAP